MRATKAQIGGFVVITALALAGATAAYIVDRRALAACDVLPRSDVQRIAGIADPPKSFEPEGDIASTGCWYGRGEPGVYITVFSIARGGSEMMKRGRAFGETHGAPAKSLQGPGFKGYVTVGPREHSESAVVVKHDHYLDMLVYNAPPGTAEQLATVAGRRLR